MSSLEFPPIAALLPHSGPMCLLDAVIEHARDRTRCTVDPARSGLFAAGDGRIPAWLGLEYMAQCIAAHGGLAARANNEPPRPGLMLGSRRIAFAVEWFDPREPLLVTASHHRGETGLVAFDCDVRLTPDHEPMVTGRVNVYIVDDWNALEGAAEDDC